VRVDRQTVEQGLRDRRIELAEDVTKLLTQPQEFTDFGIGRPGYPLGVRKVPS